MLVILGAESPLPQFKGIMEWIDGILKLIFGNKVPHWIFTAIGYVLAAAFLLLAFWGLLFALSKVVELWPKVRAIFYSSEERRRAEERRRFASHVTAQLNLLNTRETWQDYRFTELEAEVEAEGRRSGPLSALGLHRRREGLRRERSLSAALKKSRERLILVEGEPGSGKSVALRHMAVLLAERARHSRSTQSLIPLYINLKGMKRRGKDPVDRNLIESFVLETLKASNDRDVDEFLDKEFRSSLKQGTWVLLFDSFDELPEVLGSTHADLTIQQYAEAIYKFVHGLNECRGIVASRYFRGPDSLDWPRFRVQPLSPKQRVDLIRKVNLDPVAERSFLEWLHSSGESAVVICQTGHGEYLNSLLDTVRVLLAEALAVKVPSEQIEIQSAKIDDKSGVEGFRWPQYVLHICSILQDGFAGRVSSLPQDIRTSVGALLRMAFSHGLHFDRKWALEVGGATPENTLLEMTQQAFHSGSAWLMDVAYLQASRLVQVNEDVAGSIRQRIVFMAYTGTLRRDRIMMRAHLKRLPRADEFLRVASVLEWVPLLDFLFHAAVLGVVLLLYSRLRLPLKQPGDFGDLLSWFVLLALSYRTTWFDALPTEHTEKPWRLYLSVVPLLARFGAVGMIFATWTRVQITTIPEQLLVSYGLFAAAFSFYACYWGRAAIQAARAGRWTHPLAWVLFPFYPLFSSLCRFDLRESIPGIVGGIILVATFVLVAAFLPWVTTLFFVVMIIAVVVSIAGIIWQIIVGFLQDEEDRKRLHQLVGDGVKPLSPDDFRFVLSQLRTEKYVALFVHNIRSTNRLGATTDSSTAIRAEIAVREPLSTVAVLDELSMLLEQIEKRLAVNAVKPKD